MKRISNETDFVVSNGDFFYQIPSNWKWVSLGDISEITIGKSPQGCYTTGDSSYTGLIGGASDMGDVYPVITRYTKSPIHLCKKNDVILAIRATIDRVNIADDSYCIGRGVASIRSEKINSRYLMYYFQYARDYFYNVATGSTFSQVSVKDLRRMPIPLPPLDEQEYIAKKVLNSFDKLEQAKEIVRQAKKEYEDMRSYFLKQAFSGELTKAWRLEQGIGRGDWKKYTFEEVASFNNTIIDRNNVGKKDIPYITPGNIERNTGRLLAYGTLKNRNSYGGTHSFSKNEILYVRTSPEFSRVVKTDFSGVCSSEIFTIQAKANVKYLYYYMLSDYFLEELLHVNPSLERVNKEQLKRIEVDMPDSKEQEKIVELLDAFFAKEKEIYELMNVIDDVGKIKEAILAKAFHGKLTK